MDAAAELMVDAILVRLDEQGFVAPCSTVEENRAALVRVLTGGLG